MPITFRDVRKPGQSQLSLHFKGSKWSWSNRNPNGFFLYIWYNRALPVKITIHYVLTQVIILFEPFPPAFL